MEKPSKRELAALLQSLVVLSGCFPSHQKEKQSIIESVCRKYDYNPEISEMTAVEPSEVFLSITKTYTRLQFARYLLSMISIGKEDELGELQLSYFARLFASLCR